eukprot:1507925-Amphidinium_carterae.1
MLWSRTTVKSAGRCGRIQHGDIVLSTMWPVRGLKDIQEDCATASEIANLSRLQSSRDPTKNENITLEVTVDKNC